MASQATRRRPAPRTAAALVIVAIAAIGAGLVIQGPLSDRRMPSPAASPGGGAAASPGSTAATTPGSGAAASPGSTAATTPGTGGSGEWAALDLAPLPAVATLEPTTRDDAGISPDTAFTLTGLTGEPARTLAARLEVSPPTPLVVSSSSDASATVRPTQPLAIGSAYRFALRSPDGALAGSWLFRVRGPVQVTSSIPGSRTTGVPLRTGIEVTFDQEGVADMRDHFSIAPAVTGRFERHGRTQVFVPDAALEPATLYTVTVRAGLARTGTDLVLPSDAAFSFETTGPDITGVSLRFGREAIEVRPAERPVVALVAVRPDSEAETTLPTTADVRVYRIPSASAARTLSAFLAAPRWSTYADPLMPTEGLSLAASFSATLEPIQEDLLLVRFPAPLDIGSYVVEIEGSRKAHAFLQVTPVSAWVSVLSDETVVWINDVTTGRALRDATVALGEGAVFGRSNADGLAIAATPIGLVPPAAAGGTAGAMASPILTVTSAAGDSVLVPFDVGHRRRATGASGGRRSSPRTRRTGRCSSPTAASTGAMTGSRSGAICGAVTTARPSRRPWSCGSWPPAATARRRSPPSPASSPNPGRAARSPRPSRWPARPSASTRSRPSSTGVSWSPAGWRSRSSGKPAYRLDLSTDHLAVLAGAPVRWTTAATFFDGTSVPSLDLELNGGESEGGVGATTNAAGVATVLLAARTSASEGESWEDADSWALGVSPRDPEAAEIEASASVVVFPSAYDLAATGVVDGPAPAGQRLPPRRRPREGRAALDGRHVGRETPRARPSGGKALRAVVTELIPVRRQVGNEYDFIEKVVRPALRVRHHAQAACGR